jgi:hypothetical protein
MAFSKSLVCLVVYSEYLIRRFRTRRVEIFRNETSPPSNILQRRRHLAASAETITQGNETGSTKDDPPHSVALLISFAMISRGEIGFLIASLSLTSGTLTLEYVDGSTLASTELFLILVWAIVICTLVGPIAVGLIVRKSNINMLLTNPMSNVQLGVLPSRVEAQAAC